MQQLPDTFEIPESEKLAYRLGGNAMAVGVMRALLLAVKAQVLRPSKQGVKKAPKACTRSREALVASQWAVAIASKAARVSRQLAEDASDQVEHLLCASQVVVERDCSVVERMGESAARRIGSYARVWVERRHARVELARVSTELGIEEARRARVMGAQAIRMQLRRAQGKEAGSLHQYWRWNPAIQPELRNDLLLPFVKMPPRYLGENYPTAKHEKVDLEFARLYEELGYLEGPFFAESEEEIRVLNSIAAVKRKNSEKVRVVVDFTGSGCNGFAMPPRFYLPAIEDTADKAYENCWFAKIDLRDRFCVHRVRWHHRPALGMRHPYTEELWRHARLPFGFNCCPHIACRHVSYAVADTSALPAFNGRLVINIPCKATYAAPPWYAPMLPPGPDGDITQERAEVDPSMPRMYKITEGDVSYDVRRVVRRVLLGFMTS